ncbi:MAG: hypothetical protein A2X85_14310 [Geobacteraceae bacterium GWF2_54_21]|nr:MAG: hypothetical protein A2X85_14310 [Geobacteraceae bacterium GWF2_54_21]
MGRMKQKIVRMLPSVLQDVAISAHINNRRKGLKDLRTPTAIILYVTNRCNLRCGHCFFWESLNKDIPELSVSDFEKLAASLTNPISLSLTGGEPLIRNDLSEIVRCFISNGKIREVGLATNGYLIQKTKEFCSAFILEYPKIPLSVQVSLDGMESTHDEIRGCTGSFRNALSTIDALRELADQHKLFSMSAGIAVQKRNLNEMGYLIDLLGSKGIEIRINLIRGESSGTFGVTQESSSHANPKEGNSIALDVDEMHSLHSLLTSKNEAYGFWSKRHQRVYEIGMQVIEKRKKVLDCYAGTIDGVIYANGDVAFCELTKPVGNLHDYDCNLEKLWQSLQAVAMRNKVKSCFCIHGCNISTSLMFEPDIVKESVIGKTD